jgi:hypothetical protein
LLPNGDQDRSWPILSKSYFEALQRSIRQPASRISIQSTPATEIRFQNSLNIRRRFAPTSHLLASDHGCGDFFDSIGPTQTLTQRWMKSGVEGQPEVWNFTCSGPGMGGISTSDRR